MKIASGAFAVVLLAGTGWCLPVQAQAPQGSYLHSCTSVAISGDTLGANCRRADGREQRSNLVGFNRCVGDIGNNNGVLQCAQPGGREASGQVAPLLDSPRGQQVPYGAPGGERRAGEGYGSDRSDQCRGLHREAEELHGRLDREVNPIERQRIEHRLGEVREQEARCR